MDKWANINDKPPPLNKRVLLRINEYYIIGTFQNDGIEITCYSDCGYVIIGDNIEWRELFKIE